MPRAPAKKTPRKEKTSADRKTVGEGGAPRATPLEIQGSAEAAAEFLPEANEIPPREIRPLRADAALIHHNVNVGLDAVKSREADLLKLPAPFDLDAMRSLRRLALGLVYAAAQVDRSSPGTVKTLLKRAHELRDVLLSAAVALMKAGVLPAQKVRKIMAGSGARDMVQDCIDLAQLFRDHAAETRGKTAATRAQIDEAATVGNQLLALLKPKGAKAKTPVAVKDAVEARDRLWTLLSLRHEEQLRRAGMWLWVDKVDEHVPPLLSRAARKAKRPSGGGPASDGNDSIAQEGG
ncbi:hypothetical protein BE17_13145 [Sorangium cellulosum]|uniref:Uncharacterized protein n=1 Tax=Sorangium cellulosum TaxID=56 RepID=A0A150RDE1_SORCE|nr:hypothetical protein BE17_13145 [Sorangium cellulosum]